MSQFKQPFPQPQPMPSAQRFADSTVIFSMFMVAGYGFIQLLIQLTSYLIRY